MVGPHAMAPDKWIRAMGGEEENVHTGWKLRITSCKLRVTRLRVSDLLGLLSF
jgi:hypothetical protein